MAQSIVDLPIEHGDFPVRYVNVYQRVIIMLNYVTESDIKKIPKV